MADLTERVIEALDKSTRAAAEVTGEMRALKDGLGNRMHEVDGEMGTMNAHLDNLVREAQITNQLLRDDADLRKREATVKEKVEEEERKWRRDLELKRFDRDVKVEDDTRAMWRKVGDETWGILKQPLGYLIAVIVAWLLFQYGALPQGLLPTGTP